VASLETSIRDPETGLYSRLYFDEVIGRELERAKRHGFTLSVVSIILDPGPGGEAGHDKLVEAGQVLEANTRETDLVFRWERDEFLVLLFEADAAACRKKADELRALYTVWRGSGTGGVQVRLGSGTLEDGRVFAGVLQAARAAARQPG
jgi:diguanylate cyclase (GGDEF)-like protein